MRIVITGATGFIGSDLIKKINTQQNKILCISRKKNKNKKNIKWIRCSLSEDNKYKKIISEFKAEIVIHLAWEGIPDLSKKNCEKNLNISKKFLKYFLKSKYCKKIIISGTCFEYKKNIGSCDEKSKIEKNNIFSKTKTNLRQWVENRVKNKKIRFYWLRIFYAYGSEQRKDSLIPTCIRSIRMNKEPEIKNLYNINDFIFVEDISNAIKNFINKKIDSGIYNVGSGRPISIIKVIEIIYKIVQAKKYSTKFQKYLPIDGQQKFWANLKKIKKNTGWQPKYDIYKGIKKIINKEKVKNFKSSLKNN
jgi:dTDP-6-deoxy-L-talose 4-dehydrogenase (NAD+)